MSDLLTVPELAALLRVSRSKTYELLNAGTIPSLKLGRARRIPRQSVVEFIERLMSDPDA
jgi:excisionase family DNA binding protein